MDHLGSCPSCPCPCCIPDRLAAYSLLMPQLCYLESSSACFIACSPRRAWHTPSGLNHQQVCPDIPSCSPGSWMCKTPAPLSSDNIAGSLKDKLQNEIQRLATIHKGPTFTPHVTLVGGIWLTSQQDVIARATAAAKSLKVDVLNPGLISFRTLVGQSLALTALLVLVLQRFTIRLSEPSAGSTYHQCIYLLCEKDESLVETAQALREASDVKLESDYMPHLSLLYSFMSKESR